LIKDTVIISEWRSLLFADSLALVSGRHFRSQKRFRTEFIKSCREQSEQSLLVGTHLVIKNSVLWLNRFASVINRRKIIIDIQCMWRCLALLQTRPDLWVQQESP